MRPRRSQFLPEELKLEILSYLPVKSLVRFKCVSKSWNSTISDSQFIKLHLHRSSSTRNADFAHIRSLITSPSESRPAIVASPSCLPGHAVVIGTCNGLICLRKREYDIVTRQYFSHFRLWNPATRSMSQRSPPLLYMIRTGYSGFGYDCSSDTYKVVTVVRSRETQTNVYIMGDTSWGRVQVFPLRPMYLIGDAVYVNNTLNWFAFTIGKITDDRYMIFSFDLGKENCAQLSLPHCPHLSYRDNLLGFVRSLGVLRGCLCTCHVDKKMNFMIWQMKEFGVQKSWTLVLNIAGYENIIQNNISRRGFAMYMSENGDALLLLKSRSYLHQSQAILYTQKDNTVEVTNIRNNILDFYSENYIESLVSPCWKLENEASICTSLVPQIKG